MERLSEGEGEGKGERRQRYKDSQKTLPKHSEAVGVSGEEAD